MKIDELSEPDFIERDINKITDEMIKYYEEKTNKKLLPAHVERIIIDMIAYREHLMRLSIQKAGMQNLLHFARNEMLDYLGDLVGAARRDMNSASTIVKFYIENKLEYDVVIPANTRVSSKDGKVVFATEKNATINRGNLFELVHAASLKKGSEGNGYMPGEISSLIDGIDEIIKVENIRVTSGGSEKEDDEHYRERIRIRPESYTTAGTEGSYQYWVKTSHPEIIDVKVVSPEPCEVEIYPLIKEQNKYDKDSLENILDKIKATLNDEKRKPLGDRIRVKSAESINFRIKAEITIYNYGDVELIKNEIEKKITAYREKMREKLGMNIIRTQIITLLNSIYGICEVNLIEPVKSIEVKDNQWACLDGFDKKEGLDEYIKIIGYTDG